MGIELYDEITQNNNEIHDKIGANYEVVNIEIIAREIAELKKVVFVPSSLCQALEVSENVVINELHKHSLLSASIKTQLSNGSIVFLGIIATHDMQLLKQATQLYYSALEESRNSTHH